MRREEVPVEGLQRAFRDSGLSGCEVALRMGWVRTVGDSSRLRRQLGLAQQRSHGSYAIKRQTVGYERAVELIEAMGLDPVDYGL